MERRATRRELVRGGIGLAASLGAWRAGDARAAATGGSQAQALAYALQMERLAVIVYHQALGTDVLAPDVRSQLRVLVAEDQQHVRKLERILAHLGAPQPAGPRTAAAAQALLTQHQIHRSITHIPTQYDALRVLIDTESLTEGAHYKAIAVVQEPSLIRTSAEMMGSDAQHWTILSGIQHQGDVSMSVPYPYVQGSP